MAKSSSCPQESKAARWAQGDVSLEEIEALSAHLKECSSCSRVFEANQPSWMKPVNWRDPRNWLLVVAAASFYFSMRILQAVFRALPWIFVWGLGFVSGSTIAGVTVWLLGAPRGGTAVWAIGGAIGLTLASGVYGARVGWQLWWARHYDNPFAAFGIPEGQADQERAFALSLRWPAIAAASLAGAIVGALGSSCGWFTGWRWACLVAWAGAGAVGLAVEGAIMGAVLGRKRARILFDGSQGSLPEHIGWMLAGSKAGHQAAKGWSIGYALNGVVTGAISGSGVGAVALLFLQMIV